MIGPPRRPERGEVRYLVLDVLAAGPAHGYQVLQTIEDRSGGAYRPSAGSIYPTLQMLEEMGLLSRAEDGGRKVYSLTEAGRTELEAHRDEIDEAWERFSGHADWAGQFDFPALAGRVRRLFRAIGRGVRRGRIDAARMKRIQQTIEEALAALESILSDDADEG
jgi:DNA-binding PadR family transcriptional regulator